MSLESKYENINVVDLVQNLSHNVSSAYYDLGEALFFIKSRGIHETIDNGIYGEDNASWKRFCEDKLDVSYRTAQYWINIFEYFHSMLITKEQLDPIGWSKAKEIANVTDDPRVLARMMEFAATHSIAELKVYIDSYKVNQNTEEPLNQYSTVKFRLPHYQAELVTEAIGISKEMFDTQSDNDALSHIFLDWLHIRTNATEQIYE